MDCSRRVVLLTAVAAMFGVGFTHAAEPPKTTVMTVGEMCGGCVKKITARLEKMPDVGKIECDIPAKTVTVTAKAGKTLSAATVWDAMVEIGKTPKKLVGPSGTYTVRPKA